jgi:phosphate transport system protein
MAKHLQREIDALQKKLLSLASLVEEQVTVAVRSVEKKDTAAAKRIIDFDGTIDRLEIEVEEECLKLLALHQPVAIDLRFIVAVLKINNDLERIGDLAGNIAERAIALAGTPSFTFTSKLPLMCEKAVIMLRQCLDSLFKMNVPIARTVCKADEEVDNLYRDMIEIVRNGITEDVGRVDEFLLIMSVARHLERIADHATNIAEDVIYMIEGDIVRHNDSR